MGLWATGRRRSGAEKSSASTGQVPAPAKVDQTLSMPESPVSAETAPNMPAWSAAMMGLPVSMLFPNTIERCMGGAGRIGMRFTSPFTGTRVDGWSWNLEGKRTFERLIVTDAAGVIIGAGSTFVERPDVLDAHPGVVTTLISGYQVFAKADRGVVSIYGIEEATKSAGKISDRPL